MLIKNSIPAGQRIKCQGNNTRTKKNKGITFKQNPEAVASGVADILFGYTKLVKDNPLSLGETYQKCCQVVVTKAKRFIEQNKRIEMVIPAFPFKSISPQKVLGAHADMAENNCMVLFKNVVDKIQEMYKPGAEIKVYTDGYPIAPIDNVPEETVKQYIDKIGEYAQKRGLGDRFKIITLKDVYGNDLNGSRQALMNDFGKSTDQIRQQVLTDPLMSSDFCGIKRFISEEQSALHPDICTNQMNKLSRNMAYETIKYDDAWSRLMEQAEPYAIRLSSHPQPAGARKTGIRLSNTCDNWISPWHSSAVRTGDDQYVLMKRKQAEELGLKIINDNDGKPSHFEMPPGMTTNEKETLLRKIFEISPLNENKLTNITRI